MKEQCYVTTSNVRAADQAIKALLNRPKFELVGLGLIHGEQGTGKTRYGKILSNRQGYIYIRLDASESTKSFSAKLWRGLKYHLSLTQDPENYSEAQIPAGSTNYLINTCIRILRDAPETVIVIDEFDNALGKRELRETVRDIVDNTYATVVLIGMSGIHEKLKQKNPHFFDRCNFICEFKPITLSDAMGICKAVSEVEMSQKIMETTYAMARGNLRKLIKAIEKVENKIKNNRDVVFSKRDLEEIEAAGNGSEERN